MRLLLHVVRALLTLPSFYHHAVFVSAHRKPWRQDPVEFEQGTAAAAISRTPLGEHVSTAQRRRLHTVADLLLEVYHTLADMRYLDPAGIETGPHAIDIDLCQQQDIAVPIIYLYQILPYVNTSEAGQQGFAFGGLFTDFRDPELLRRARDPFYSAWEDCGPDCLAEDPLDQNLPYMAPWATPLTGLGNHGAIIIYDSKLDVIKVIDQLDDQSRDLALQDLHTPWRTSSNRNSIDHIPGRPAADVLRDMVQWYRNLELIPGDDVDNGVDGWDHEILKTLYQKAGWPDKFDGEAFELYLARHRARERAKYQLNEPLQQVDKYQLWVDLAEREITTALERITSGTTPDELWLAGFELWKMKRSQARNLQDLERAQAEARHLCPLGDCLTPQDVLLLGVEHLRFELERAWADDHSHPRHRAQRRKILQQAWKEAENEIKLLYPQEYANFPIVPYLPWEWFQMESLRLRSTCDYLKEEMKELELWLSKELPPSAHNSRKVLLDDLERLEESREAHLWQIQNDMRRQIAMWTTSRPEELLGFCRIA